MSNPFVSMKEMTSGTAKVLLYGESGSGKTFVACRLNNVLVVDFEEGLKSAPMDGSMKGLEDPANLRAAFETSRDDFPNVSVTVTEVTQLKTIWTLIKEHPGRFDTLVLDSVTTLGEMTEEWIRTRFSSAGTQRVQADNKADGDIVSLTMQGWGYAQNKLGDALSSFRFLPVNIVFVFHETAIVNKDQPTRYLPKFKGKDLPAKIKGYVDFGIRVEIATHKVGPRITTRRQFRCHPTPTVWAKCRDGEGGLLAEHEPADLNALLAKVTGRNEKSTPVTTTTAQTQLTAAS